MELVLEASKPLHVVDECIPALSFSIEYEEEACDSGAQYSHDDYEGLLECLCFLEEKPCYRNGASLDGPP